MKKRVTLLLVFTSTLTAFLYGQGGNPGNLRVPGAFLGWNGLGPAGSLDLRNNFVGQPINFFIAGTQQMTVAGGTGFVGIGPGFAAPASMLHIHDGFISTFQMTNAITTAAAGRGFRILQLFGQIRLGQQEANEMFFHTGGAIAAANERMVIMGAPGATQGFIGFGTNFIAPQSLVHVSAFNNATGNVFRTDGGNTFTNIWEMLTGPNTGTLTRKGAFINLPASNTFTTEASAGDYTITANG